MRAQVCPLPLSGGLSPEDLGTFGRGLLASLAVLHSIGIFSRDVKPDNIMAVRRAASPDAAEAYLGMLEREGEGGGEGSV